MDPRRQRYLDALGVQRWVSRQDAGTRLGEDANAPSGLQPVPQATSAAAKPAIAALAAQAPAPAVAVASPADDSDWDGLAAQVAACTACSLHQTRTQTVFGVGNRRADWLVIGEAPGEQEDLKGEPFVGRAGQLLNEMLRAVGQSREDVYIANILKCRPPGNRDPKPEEAGACEAFLRRQVELIRPKIILSVGRISAQNLLKTDAPVGKLRGRVHRYGDIPLVVVYHPAYLLRSLTEKRKAWDDLRLALKAYREMAPVSAES